MGGAVSVNNRYMGGKTLLKFFREDTWPALEDLFERFDMNESAGFEVFKVFARTDVNEDGLVDLNECFRYLGGRRTKFTERILYSESTVDEVGDIISGLTFKNFLIAVWNFCTLTPEGVARYCFEIFDVDDTEMLEKPDIIAMFMMLYNTEEHEEEYISMYRFDQYPKVSKENFCTVSAKYKYLIQPALDYQNLLRRRVGGKAMWSHLTKHRERALKPIDQDERTLGNAVSEIVVSSKNFSKRFDAPSADKLIETSQKRVATDTEMAERELRLQQRRLESESRSLRATAPDRKMHQAWAILNSRKQAFEEEEYLTTDMERRNRDRQTLFALFDVAKMESIAYWQYKDVHDMEVTEGSAADHEARYQDHLASPEGRVMLEFVTLLRLFELVVKDIEDKVEKMKRKPKNKSERHLIFESQRNELQKVMDNLSEEGLTEHDQKKRMKFLLERDFTEDHLFAKKNTKKSEQMAAADIAHRELCAKLKVKTLADKRAEIAAAQEERRRGYIIKEFEITTNYGSRTTRWEYVLKKDENKMTYMARDTFEMRHPKTAICETCDGIFVQHELHCDGCNGPRSAKNLKLYRPLGFKDITTDLCRFVTSTQTILQRPHHHSPHNQRPLELLLRYSGIMSSSANYAKVAGITAAVAAAAIAAYYLLKTEKKETAPVPKSGDAPLALPVVDFAAFFNKDKDPEAYRKECTKAAFALYQYGLVVLRDPRVAEADNDRFVDMMEKYFEGSDGLRDARPEYGYQVGVTKDRVELPRNHCKSMGAFGPDNKPLSPCPPEKDPKWRFFWRTGPQPPTTEFKTENMDAVIPAEFPEWKDVMDGWGGQMTRALFTLAEMAAVGFHMPADAFTSRMLYGPHLLAPTGSDFNTFGKEGTVLAGFHYDLNFLTIHGKSRFPGLYVWTRQGVRTAVSVPDGCLLVQAGKQIEYLTGGHVLAGFHEVVVNKSTSKVIADKKAKGESLWRVSSTCFGHIASDQILEPLAPFNTPEAVEKFPAIKAGNQVIAELKAIALK